MEVEWLDSMSEGTWLTVEEALEKATPSAMKHRTVGYLLHGDKDSLVLAMGHSEQGEGDNRLIHSMMQIPRCAILDIADLETVSANRETAASD